MFDQIARILAGAPVRAGEIRVAAAFLLVWFIMDAFWFLATLFHLFGL